MEERHAITKKDGILYFGKNQIGIIKVVGNEYIVNDFQGLCNKFGTFDLVKSFYLKKL